MRNKLLVTLLIAVMAVSMLSACGKNDSSGSTSGNGSSGNKVTYDDGFGENVFRITYQAEPESADPACTTADYILMMNCMDTLVKTETNDKNENVTVPWVAKSWEISDDGLTYKFKLRDDVKFHNGEKLTADDVLYTVDRMLQPERAAVNTSWMDVIAGAQDVLDGKAKTVEGKGIIIEDDYNFSIVLADSYAPFLACLSTPAWSLCNREAGEKADEAGGGAATSVYGSDPAYFSASGPFILKEWELNDHVFLETNKDYWAGASDMDGILLKIIPDAQTEKMLFDSGQIDIFDLDHALDQIPTYRDNPDYKNNFVEKTVLGTSYLSLNESIEPLGDVKVRKALQMAIDRDTLIQSMYYGAATPACTFLPEGVPGYDKDSEPIKYDPEGAKKLLEEAGYADGFDLTITQTTDSSQSDQEVNEAIAKMFEAIGVRTKIEQYDNATWYSVRSNGELPMYRTSWIADFNDPDNFLYQMYGSSSNKARSWNYYNTEAIARLEAARHMTDEKARTEEYKALDKLIIRDDAAMIPLWHRVKVRVIQDRVKNFVPMWAGYGDCCYYGTSLG